MRDFVNIKTDSDTLFCKVTGQGQPLLIIAGGVGNGNDFLPLADMLQSQFKVITYDRPIAKNFTIEKQVNDILTVLEHFGIKETFVFGASSGAVIGLELATRYPDKIKKAVLFEPPIIQYSNNKDKWQKFFEQCHNEKSMTKFSFGVLGKFTLKPIFASNYLKKYIRNEPKDFCDNTTEKQKDAFFIEHELLPITNYKPDIEKLKCIKNKIAFACGDWSIKKKLWFADVVYNLSQTVDTEKIIFNGMHISYMNKQKEWAEIIKGWFQ